MRPFIPFLKENPNYTAMNTVQLVVQVFLKNKNEAFTQHDIGEEIKKLFANNSKTSNVENQEISQKQYSKDKSRSQSAISKALSKLTETEWNIPGGPYYLTCRDRKYQLSKFEGFEESALHNFASKTIGISVEVFKFSDYIIAYKLDAKGIEPLLKYLYLIFKEHDELFDYMLNDNKLYIYINPNANNKLHIANYLMNIPNKLSKKQKLVIRNKAIKRLQKEKQES